MQAHPPIGSDDNPRVNDIFVSKGQVENEIDRAGGLATNEFVLTCAKMLVIHHQNKVVLDACTDAAAIIQDANEKEGGPQG